MTLIRSWIESANTKQTDFPLNNLPYGVFTVSDSDPHCCVAIGDMVLDVTSLEELEILEPSKNEKVFNEPYWNSFMELGPETWALFRKNLTDLLKENFNEAIAETKSILENSLIPQKDCILHMPFVISEFTDFFASYHHAKNVGTMFRGPENALPPNWLHIPIGYNGRASTVIVSGTDVKRPRGQLKPPTEDIPYFGPSKRFDFELELGAIVGTNTDIGTALTTQEADDMIFGYVILNDWSARDIQAWEYQPLGPFQAKATATTISPWIVTKAALEPFRKFTPKREVPLLKYLEEKGPMLYDIDLSVSIETNSSNGSNEITRTNYSEMYYSSAQQLAHHTSSGCAMSCGDLLGSGTISGPEKHQYGSMLELSWGGKNPIQLQGSETRTFLEDGDIIRMSGAADGGDYKIGFGENIGKIIPANK
jgi:fumarylacetoacetase